MNKPLDMPDDEMKDFPDSPGTWFSFLNLDAASLSDARGNFLEVSEDMQTIYCHTSGYTYPSSWMRSDIRLWFKLTMPWDAEQPAAGVPLPVFRQTVETERNISFIQGILEGVKARAVAEKPVLRHREYTIRRCGEVLAWLQRQREAGE